PLLLAATFLLLSLVARTHGLPFSGGLTAHPPSGVIAAVIGAGYFYSLAGVTVAHELSHRITNPLAPLSARILFALTLNPTHHTPHVYGHHRNVGKYADPSTARRGEYVLAFVARSAVGQSIEGWRLEAERLRRKGLAVWSWRNRVLAGIGCSLAIVA